MSNGMVSIILPTYNRADTLDRAIKSVLMQTYRFYELIIVDDGSSDDTEELVMGYSDKRIRYLKLNENGGQAKARNYGIGQAKYDYIAFEDSDDTWYPEKLGMQVEAMRLAPPEVGFIYHKIRYDMGNHYFAVLPPDNIENTKKSGNIYAQLLYDNLVPCPSILARKECILKAGGFDAEMMSLEDYDLVLKMAKHHKAVFIDRILLDASYSVTGVSGNSVQYLMASCRLLQKYKQDYLKTGTLNHRMEVILRDARRIGMQEAFTELMELSLRG